MTDVSFSRFWMPQVQDQGAGRLGSWWGLASWLTGGFWPHMVEEERDLVPLPLTRTLLSSWGPTLMTSRRPYLQVPLYWGTGLRHRNLVGGTHSAYYSLVCDRIDCSPALPCARLPTSAMPSSHFPSFLCVGGDHMTSFGPIRRKKTPRGFWE